MTKNDVFFSIILIIDVFFAQSSDIKSTGLKLTPVKESQPHQLTANLFFS